MTLQRCKLIGAGAPLKGFDSIRETTLMVTRAAQRRRTSWLVTVAVVVAVSAAAIWFVVIRRQTPIEATGRPHAVSTYDGVALGMTMNDVIGAKGVPPTVYGPTEIRNGVPVQEPIRLASGDSRGNPRAMAAAHDDWWSYPESGGARLDVYFSPRSNRVSKVTCESVRGGGACPPLWGIKLGSSQKDIASTLGGPPDLQDVDPQGPMTLSYQRYSLEFVLRRGKLIQIGMVKTVPVPAKP